MKMYAILTPARSFLLPLRVTFFGRAGCLPQFFPSSSHSSVNKLAPPRREQPVPKHRDGRPSDPRKLSIRSRKTLFIVSNRSAACGEPDCASSDLVS